MIGVRSGSPYTAAVEEKTIVRTPISRIASSSASVPPRLVDQYLAGSATDSPTSDFAAKCRTASMPSASTSAAQSRSVPLTKVTPAGTASAYPVDRSSSTVTSCPAAPSCAATTLPMYPAPPVTSTLMKPPEVIAGSATISLTRTPVARVLTESHTLSGLDWPDTSCSGRARGLP